ncbi:hypothetical protein TTHERM_00703710 (macronuclear) [Tetrahymena thermophila SB210]|uniref:Uncharacterized protein n=1 Tax=Tetrahymena thermophila (strain SB210) TaxID=312017 RepID=Q22GF2_TETTS|nr:hypothetical protein TTHERM_00703710 [Tetrahymena thermophila SB210]EAR84379.2 hypothetical protein TTHERM_00703710 [Tetrahymena thermophila SB210]|eukprot:XP_001032042.2 hypothetical protein TTHERM_00703710 [Tetrahymena thermophila SB210]
MQNIYLKCCRIQSYQKIQQISKQNINKQPRIYYNKKQENRQTFFTQFYQFFQLDLIKNNIFHQILVTNKYQVNMKLGAAKKPLPPKTKEQKEKDQQQVQNSVPNQNEDVEQLVLEIQKVYGNRFQKEDILKELQATKFNKSAAISNLMKQKEQIEKLEEKLAALKIQQASTQNTQKEKSQIEYNEMKEFFGYKKQNQNVINISIPINLLQEIEQNFQKPRLEQ